MILKDVRGEVYYFSRKGSELIQKLSFGGIAVIWLFRELSNNKISFDNEMIYALICFIATILIELIHYLVFAPIWNFFYNKKSRKIKDENKGKKDDEIEQIEVSEPKILNGFGWGFFYLKAAIVGFAYYYLLISMLDKLTFN